MHYPDPEEKKKDPDGSDSIICTVNLLYGNSKHVAHVWRKLGLLWNEFPFLPAFDLKIMP